MDDTRLQTAKVVFFLWCALSSLTAWPSKAQVSAPHSVARTQGEVPQPAIPGILNAFRTYEVIAMEAGHDGKDVDDFILSLIRDSRFPESVNDIVVECGNVRYQGILDKYIAGENVPFAEVRHVWRETTVFQMCGASGFYDELFPLVRSLNQRLPASRRLRVVAADPPIDWNKIRSYDDLRPFFDRDGSIASVMEREVLSKHHKALMLFGLFHLVHGGGPGEGDAVTRYERHYPGRTFVISGGFGYFDADHESLESLTAPGGTWPSLIKAKSSRLGALSLDSFFASPLWTDKDCNVTEAFTSSHSKGIADQIDAFIYLGPQKAMLTEPLPADIALDRDYRSEWLRRLKLVGLPSPATLEELNAQIVASAGEPLAPAPTRQLVSQEMKSKIRQGCLSQNHFAVDAAK
jgi:hypothetical protein